MGSAWCMQTAKALTGLQKRRLVLALAGCIRVKSHFCLSQKEKKSCKHFGISEALALVCSVLLNLLILSLLLVDKS